jgi:hypothetical protein
MAELLTHDDRIADPAPQRAFVHDRPQHQRVPAL